MEVNSPEAKNGGTALAHAHSRRTKRTGRPYRGGYGNDAKFLLALIVGLVLYVLIAPVDHVVSPQAGQAPAALAQPAPAKTALVSAARPSIGEQARVYGGKKAVVVALTKEGADEFTQAILNNDGMGMAQLVLRGQ